MKRRIVTLMCLLGLVSLASGCLLVPEDGDGGHEHHHWEHHDRWEH